MLSILRINLASSALRLAPAARRATRLAIVPRYTVPRAAFSTTSCRNASEEPETQALLEQQQKVARIMQTHPELAEMIIDFKNVLESEGIEVNGTTMPSKLDMVRMFMKPKVREAAEKLFAKFQEAGLDTKEIMDFGLSMAKRK